MPTEFLGVPLSLTFSEAEHRAWTGGMPYVQLYIRLEENLRWMDGTVSAEYWTAWLRIPGCGVEEYGTDSYSDLEAYFEKWISDFKNGAKLLSNLWPDLFNNNTKTGRLSSKHPHLANGPKPDNGTKADV